jgi:protein SCO1
MTKRLVTFAALLLALLTPDALRAGTAAASNGTPYGANFFSNVTLVTQDGKQVRFYDDLLKDKKVLIDFIYASCTQSCPLQTAKLAQLQKALGSRVGHDIFIYSITLDPEHDTPQVLKAYAEKFGAGPGWLFLTGKPEDVDLVRFKLGERGEKEGHGNSVRLGDVAKSQWMRLPLTGDVNYLVTEVGKTLIPNWYGVQPAASFDDAPRIEIPGAQRDQLLGQGLFLGRCASCHTIGGGERIGPDLKGVTDRRKRDWLVRYLLAPDRMLASKDPIAVELAKNHKVPMPNLGLTHEQIDDLIAYLEMQTSHPQPSKATAQPLAKKR